MTKFIKGALSVILSLFLALGWLWTNLLKDLGIITDDFRIRILIVLTFVFAIQQIYLVIPKPSTRGLVEKRKEIVEEFLEGFLHRYYERLEAILGDNQTYLPAIRVNVMLPTKRLRGFLGSYLKIYYSKCPSGIIYSDDELSEKWKKDNGTCGWTWKHGTISVYDSRVHKGPELRLSNPQKMLTRSIRSVLSVPIWYNNSVIGILNLDSKNNVIDTLFDHNDVYRLTQSCANALSSICDENGVAARL